MGEGAGNRTTALYGFQKAKRGLDELARTEGWDGSYREWGVWENNLI